MQSSLQLLVPPKAEEKVAVLKEKKSEVNLSIIQNTTMLQSVEEFLIQKKNWNLSTVRKMSNTGLSVC